MRPVRAIFVCSGEQADCSACVQDSNSGVMFRQQPKQMSWCPDRGERRRTESRGRNSYRRSRRQKVGVVSPLRALTVRFSGVRKCFWTSGSSNEYDTEGTRKIPLETMVSAVFCLSSEVAWAKLRIWLYGDRKDKDKCFVFINSRVDPTAHGTLWPKSITSTLSEGVFPVTRLYPSGASP